MLSQQNDPDIIEAADGIPMIVDKNGEGNPHVWVSLSNAAVYVQNIADRLSDLDAKMRICTGRMPFCI